MNATVKAFTRRLQGFAHEIKNVLKDLYSTFEQSAPCCGIRLDRNPNSAVERIGTAGTCCGVRM
jgi:hypothetical protein